MKGCLTKLAVAAFLVLALLLALRLAFAGRLQDLVDRAPSLSRDEQERLELFVRYSPSLGGRWAAGTLEGIVEGGHQASAVSWLALDALAALARIRPQQAAELLEELDPTRTVHNWWRPPAPGGELLARITAPVDRSGVGEVDSLYYRALDSCVTTDAAGGEIVVFPEDSLGSSQDLWARWSADPAEEVSVFLGPYRPQAYGVGRMSCEVVGGFLDLSWPEEAENPPVRLDLTELKKDADGDGIPDLAERRLLLDPKSTDTDGDGLSDPLDPSPNGGGAALGDDAARIAIASQIAVFSERPCVHTKARFVLAVEPLEWRARCGPTINVPRRRIEELPAGTDLLIIDRDERDPLALSDLAGLTLPEMLEHLFGSLPPRGEVFVVVNNHIGSDSEGYEIRIRPYGGEWLIVWQELLWL